MLRIDKVEFIPPTAIFGRSLPVPFTHDLVHLTRGASNTLSSYLKTITIKRVPSLPLINNKDAESFYSWVAAIKNPNRTTCFTKTAIPCSTPSQRNQTCTTTNGTTTTSSEKTDDSSCTESTSLASHLHYLSSYPDPSLLSEPDDEPSDMEVNNEDLAAALASLDMSFD